MKRFFLICAFYTCLFFIAWQPIKAQELHKTLHVVRTNNNPRIDAKLDDEAWQNAEKAGDFLQIRPYNGKPAWQKTEVQLTYDDKAIYVGAMLFDSAPDSILTRLGERDNLSSVDFFGIWIDPYNDGQNAFAFLVTAAGVQTDLKASQNGNEDDAWNAVWQSAVRVTDQGWVVEMKIPYSALRFPKNDVQTWGINMAREINRHRQQSSWNYIDVEKSNFINQFGVLTGIENIKPPLRLSLTPYAATYIEHQEGSGWGRSIKGGLDLKYGINESFTLDMMLIPDFGQVQSDDQRLNLSPFETYYDENRSFFTEGTELFNKAGIFYSKRIGGTPREMGKAYDSLATNEIVEKNPTETQLINATKISGKTSKNLSIGFLNALTANTYATITDTVTNTSRKVKTQPFSSYNLIVLDQSFANNSYASIINTNVVQGDYIANVTGTEFKINNKKQTYGINGAAAFNHITKADHKNGYTTYLEGGKISGKFKFSLYNNIESEYYNPNDMGFLFSPNEISSGLRLRYNITKPFGYILDWYNSFNVSYETLYNPLVYSQFSIYANTNMTLKNHLTVGGFFGFSPWDVHDYFEARVPGRVFKQGAWKTLTTWISSDFSKPLALTINATGWLINREGEKGYDLWIEPRWRVNDQILIKHSFSYAREYNDMGFVTISNDSIIMGRRHQHTYNNTTDISWIFTPKMGLSFRMRHYWSKAIYNKFYLLRTDGYLDDYPNYTNPDADINYNAFNIDLVYTWEFAPGSELSLVWKNAVYSYGSYIQPSYSKNIDYLFEQPGINSFSAKVLYYLDYQYLKRKSDNR